jgi:hypothetical protein
MICIIFPSNWNQAVHALQEFHGVFQNDMTVHAYCSRLKIIVADTLRDVGDPIYDPLQSPGSPASATMDAHLRLNDAEWIQIDACIISWFYTTVSAEVLPGCHRDRCVGGHDLHHLPLQPEPSRPRAPRIP